MGIAGIEMIQIGEIIHTPDLIAQTGEISRPERGFSKQTVAGQIYPEITHEPKCVYNIGNSNCDEGK